MHEQIRQATLLSGKVIEKVVDYEDDGVWILLEGERFAVFVPVEGYCDEAPGVQLLVKAPELSSRWPSIGICTAEEYQVLSALHSFDVAKAEQLRQRRLYERLKRRFENTSP